MTPAAPAAGPQPDRRLGMLAAGLVTLAIAAVMLLAPSPALAAAPAGFVGLQAWGDPSAEELEKLKGANVKTFRAQVSWASVQPTKDGGYRWDRYDRIFEDAGERGITILPVLLGAPSWVSAEQQDPPTSPAEKTAFNNFAAAAAKRYGPKSTFWTNRGLNGAAVGAKYWQVWNEPNLPNYWNDKPRASQYAAMVKGAHAAVQTGSAKGATTILAGLPYTNVGPSPPDFLKQMFSANPTIYKHFSAAAVHPYAKYPSYAVEYGVKPVRSTLNSLLRPHRVYRDLWVTEIGWATGTPDGRFKVSSTTQARYLEDFYNRLLAVRGSWRIRGAMWFSLADLPAADSWSEKTGLFTASGTPKPSWYRLNCVTGTPDCKR